jgi:predicted O-linked N-acetylglucosamine transferase (SPINDLY family)
LRVGYVSADLRDHSVAFFIEPVLAARDRDEFHVTCYYNFPRADAVTARLRAQSDGWRDVAPLSDEALARLIREDGIDVLVDLSGHTAHNRLLTFARKPAPVQMTWLGYLNTTGLGAMDYRITDARACPPGPLDTLHSEALVRLPDSQWCYRAPAKSPEIAALPASAGKRITFGALTNLAKISAATIEVWSRLLRDDTKSQLRIAGRGMSAVEGAMRAAFERRGVAADRLELLEHGPFQDYLASHGSIDIMLDTFPYTGGTTTCHALWMGVPVVTLAGDTATSRGGASLLYAVGLPELVADTPNRYVETASALAADLGRLRALRATMRERMRSSPLMDEARFARNLEAAYRAAWRKWCESPR